MSETTPARHSARSGRRSLWSGLTAFLFGSAWRREGRVYHFEGVLPVEFGDINRRRERKGRKPVERLQPGPIPWFGDAISAESGHPPASPPSAPPERGR